MIPDAYGFNPVRKKHVLFYLLLDELELDEADSGLCGILLLILPFLGLFSHTMRQALRPYILVNGCCVESNNAAPIDVCRVATHRVSSVKTDRNNGRWFSDVRLQGNRIREHAIVGISTFVFHSYQHKYACIFVRVPDRSDPGPVVAICNLLSKWHLTMPEFISGKQIRVAHILYAGRIQCSTRPHNGDCGHLPMCWALHHTLGAGPWIIP